MVTEYQSWSVTAFSEPDALPLAGVTVVIRIEVAVKGLSFGSLRSKEPAASMLNLRRNSSVVLLPEVDPTRMT